MAMNSGAFSRLVAPGLRKVFFDKLKEWKEEYSIIAHIESSKRQYEEELTMGGAGRFERKPKGQSLIYDDFIQGNVKRYTHLSFALGFRVERELYDDDLYGVMRKFSRELAVAARQTVELEFALMLDDAFTGTNYVGADAKALCARDHPLLTGGTYANEPAAQVDLAIGSLRAASERMERLVNERGLPEMRGRGKHVLVTPTYQWAAKEIIHTTGQAYTADNTLNAFDGMDLGFSVNHYMADDDMWFLFADKADHDIKFFWRQKPMFENGDDFDTKDAKFSGYMRFSLGWTDWRGVDGSSGG